MNDCQTSIQIGLRRKLPRICEYCVAQTWFYSMISETYITYIHCVNFIIALCEAIRFSRIHKEPQISFGRFNDIFLFYVCYLHLILGQTAVFTKCLRLCFCLCFSLDFFFFIVNMQHYVPILSYNWTHLTKTKHQCSYVLPTTNKTAMRNHLSDYNQIVHLPRLLWFDVCKTLSKQMCNSYSRFLFSNLLMRWNEM